MKKIFTSFLLFIILLNAKSQCNNLFISEYIEGSGNSKAIEIYNPTNATIPLTGVFSIRMYFNGSPTPTTFALTGSILPGAVHVFSTTTADPLILAQADQTSAAAWYNGDDAIELYNTFFSTSVDVIGVIGVDPGTEWTVNGASGTVNKTLVRKSSINAPNTVWTGSGEMGWDIFLQDDFTHLGAHTMTPCASTPTIANFTNTDVCLGSAMTFAGSATGGNGGPYFYFWDFGDGVGTSNVQNPTYTYATSGNFNVQLIAVDGTGNDDTITQQVTVFSLPVACTNPTPNTGNGCAPDTLDFINCSTGNGPLTYSWTFSNGNVSTATQPTQIFNDDTAWVQLMVTDANGCIGNFADGGDINLPDDASFSYAASTYCVGDSDPLPTITGLSGGTFSSGTASLNSGTGLFDLSVSGVGTHIITYTTNGPCPTSAQVSIDITGLFDATITPVSAVCENASAFTLSAVDAGGTWSATCGTCINTTTGSFNSSIAGPGTHTITYTISGACGNVGNTNITVNAQDFLNIYNSDTTICNDIFGFFLSAEVGGTWSDINSMVSDNADGTGFFSSAAITPGTYYAVYSTSSACPFADSIAIDVYDYPVANFTFSGTLGNISFTNTSTNATSYLWDFDDSSTSTQTNPTHVFTLNGTYSVCLTATNASGCENTSCQNVNVTGLGITENSNLKMNVYPNPSNGNFTVESNSIITKISIKNIIGQNVFTKNANANNAVISLEDVNNGFYFIELETENGKAVKRIEITK